MLKFKFLKKIIHLIGITALTILVFACNQHIKKSNLEPQTDIVTWQNNINTNYNIDYKNYDIFDISPAKIIIPQNQTESQSLSVVVSDGHDNLIVIDGGRVEDSDYLCEIIKDNGGVVSNWYITHIHDDHLGALYDILNKKRTDIVIKEISYQFADFNWYYSKIGNDAGVINLFINAISDYNSYLSSVGKDLVNVEDNILSYDKRARAYVSKDENDKLLSEIVVYAINENVYELDQDPINNTSIVYYIDIDVKPYNQYPKDLVSMIVFGDLGYDGGKKLFYYTDEFEDGFKRINEADILVLSHHGQNGIDPELYKKFSPKVVVWPTSKDIYENTHGKYYTDDTKKALSEMSSIEYEIKSYDETAVIR